MPLFTGVVPPVVTPLTSTFEVDYSSLTRVINHLLSSGVHGLFVLGSTSEVVFHDEATRLRILEHTINQNNGQVPIFAGVIDPATERVIGHAKAAQSAGANAVVVTAPFYTRTSQPEIVDHFRYVRDALDIPVIAYDIPVCVGTKLERQTTYSRPVTSPGRAKSRSGSAGCSRWSASAWGAPVSAPPASARSRRPCAGSGSSILTSWPGHSGRSTTRKRP